MGQIFRERIGLRSAWKASDFESADAYSTDVTPRHLAAFDQALADIHRRGLSLHDVGAGDFAVPSIMDDVLAMRAEVVSGRGFHQFRGLPIDRYSQEDLELIFWGLGVHVGVARSQSVHGDRLGHMIDTTDKDPNARAYRNKSELLLHTDLCDVIAIMALSKAAKGGMSLLASAHAVHNEIVAQHPEYLDAIYRGGPYHRMNEQGPGEGPYTEHDVPALSLRDGVVSCRYVRELMDAGLDLAGRALSSQAKAAFDFFDVTAARSDMCLRYVMQPGEIMFYNNWIVLHGRTAFENGPRPDQKRHLMRLWLDIPEGRPVVPETAVFGAAGVAYQEGKVASADLHKYTRRLAIRPEERLG